MTNFEKIKAMSVEDRKATCFRWFCIRDCRLFKGVINNE